MSFFKKMKDRMFKSSSKIEDGLEAIVEEEGSVDAPADPPVPDPVAPPEQAAPAPLPEVPPAPLPVPACAAGWAEAAAAQASRIPAPNPAARIIGRRTRRGTPGCRGLRQRRDTLPGAAE